MVYLKRNVPASPATTQSRPYPQPQLKLPMCIFTFLVRQAKALLQNLERVLKMWARLESDTFSRWRFDWQDRNLNIFDWWEIAGCLEEGRPSANSRSAHRHIELADLIMVSSVLVALWITVDRHRKSPTYRSPVPKSQNDTYQPFSYRISAEEKCRFCYELSLRNKLLASMTYSPFRCWPSYIVSVCYPFLANLEMEDKHSIA